MKYTYRVTLHWTDPKRGPQNDGCNVEAPNIRSAINRALAPFLRHPRFTDSNQRRTKRAINEQVTIEALRLGRVEKQKPNGEEE